MEAKTSGKKAFSAKQKKKQLADKRRRKAERAAEDDDDEEEGMMDVEPTAPPSHYAAHANHHAGQQQQQQQNPMPRVSYPRPRATIANPHLQSQLSSHPQSTTTTSSTTTSTPADPQQEVSLRKKKRHEQVIMEDDEDDEDDEDEEDDSNSNSNSEEAKEDLKLVEEMFRDTTVRDSRADPYLDSDLDSSHRSTRSNSASTLGGGSGSSSQLFVGKSTSSSSSKKANAQTGKALPPVPNHSNSNSNANTIVDATVETRAERVQVARHILHETMQDNSLRNRRFMHLFLESKMMVEQRKRLRSKPIERHRHSLLEYAGFTHLIEIPRRPSWTYEMSREEVEANEEKMFEQWLLNIFETYEPDQLNYFECNLEMWRQMWRTLERSDTVAVVVDIRHPLLHVPKNLIDYITVHSKRKMLIVLNKCDLVPVERQKAWIEYFGRHFPDIPSVVFSSRGADIHVPALIQKLQEMGAHKVGMLGHPSVGKSSLLNALVERKVVSTSRTPGHTKHFQTFFVNKELMLIDCPGLMFPVTGCERHVQILCGLFPLAQVREPYSAIRTLAEQVPVSLEETFHLTFPSEEDHGQLSDRNGEWSPYALCVAYAVKKGYMNKGGAPNVHRASYEILRDCVDGVLDFSFDVPTIAQEYTFGHGQFRSIPDVPAASQSAHSSASADASSTPSA
jgi:ribosome biogenesis GTPase A